MAYQNFQREGANNNPEVGNAFELQVQQYLAQHMGLALGRRFRLDVGVFHVRPRQFDLGSGDPPVLVECKSYRWTRSGNAPSAKLSQFVEAMYYFYLVRPGFRKMVFLARHHNEERDETLAHYIVRTRRHLIPRDVEVWEFNEATGETVRLEIQQ